MNTMKTFMLLCLFISISNICQAQWLTGTNGIYYNNYVGIGTNTPRERLELNGNFIQSPNNYLFLGHVGSNNTRLRISTNDLGGAYMDYSPYLYIRTSDESNIMTFTPNGYIGIGTTSPRSQLELNGSFIQSPNQFLFLGYVSSSNDTRLRISTNDIFGAYMDYSHALYVRTTNQNDIMSFLQNGNVGIGTTNPTVKLDVIGVVRAHEVKVCLNQGCDYVFADDYKLMNLNDLSSFVKTNKHLPDVAPATEMETEGINLSEMNALLLKKVEELTLYILQQEERIKALEAK